MFFTSTGWILSVIFLNILPFAPVQLNGQIVQSERIEIPLGRHEPLFEVIPAQEDGLFLYRQLIINTVPLIELVKLDTSFQKQWQGYLTPDPKFELMGKRKKDNHLYLLMRHREITRKDLHLFVVSHEDGKYEKHIIRNFIPFIPSEFQIAQQGAVIGGYYNNVPVVLFYSFVTRNARIVPGLLNEAGELTQVKINPEGGFSVLISAKTLDGNKTIFIKHYDDHGDLMYHFPLKTEGNKHLLFGRSIHTGNETQLIAGTYSNRKSEYSKGVFIASVTPDGFQQIKYYNYGDLENFFKYLKVKREQRIRDRIVRRRESGKNLRFNYRFIVHEIVPYKNQFVLLGEAFYPKYINTDSRLGFGFFTYGSVPFSPTQNGRIFDGYRYTHAVVMGFDKNGKLLWDNSFEINDIKTFTLEQFVKLEMQPDKIALMYLFDNQIRSKIIEGNQVLEGKTLEPIRTFHDQESMRRERNLSSKSRMDYWYDDYFYAFGVQQLSHAGYGERRVFYVNKISYSNSAEAN